MICCIPLSSLLNLHYFSSKVFKILKEYMKHSYSINLNNLPPPKKKKNPTFSPRVTTTDS